MRLLSSLPKGKPISREALARCVEAATNDVDLAEKIRADTSFDVVIASTAILSQMEVELYRFSGAVPLYHTYCGVVVQKAVSQLRYAGRHNFLYPSTIRIPYKKSFYNPCLTP